MRRGDKRIVRLADDPTKFVRVPRGRDEDVKLADTGTIASEVMVCGVTLG